MQILELRAVDPACTAVFGGKACGLARLVAAGARVPEGFAVEATTAPPEAWPEDARREMRHRAAALLAGGPLAVRSSAVGEDSAERSFAGIFDTVLGVTDVDTALAAAGRCIASGHSERTRAYAGEDALRVGLVVQSLVHARAAGVCFTKDPAGRDAAVVIEAVAGAGDALVAGRAQPESWRVYRSGLGTWEAQRDARSPGPVLDENDALAVAAEAAALAARFGHPLDLEWAFDGSGLFWLQARPVTAAAAPPLYVIDRFGRGDDGPVTVWSNWNVRETMPDPFSPLSATLWRDVIVPTVLADIVGVPPDSVLGRHLGGLDLVHGRIYWNMNAMLGWPFGRSMLRLLSAMDTRTATLLKGLVGAGVLRARRLPRSARRFALGMAWATLRTAGRLVSGVRPRRSLARLAECGVAISRRAAVIGMSDAELLREMRLLGEPESAGLRRAQQMLASGLLVYAAADRAFRPYPEARRLLATGIRGNPTTEISIGIDLLAEAAQPLAAAFSDSLPARELLARIAAEPGGPAWLERLEEFLARNGQRCPKEFDVAAPRWADDPTMILELVRAQLFSPSAERASKRLARLGDERRRAIAAAAAAAPAWRRPLLRVLAHLVELYMPLREAPKHYAMFVFQRMRLAAHELGARLRARGVIEDVEDVFYLEWPELQALFGATGVPAPPQACGGLVGERKERYRHFLVEKPPDILRSDGVPVGGGVEPPPADGVLRGTGASAGRVSGPVRVLREPDPRAMEEGDVIVVEFADPGWTPLFPRARAIVMEVGGTMCHAAVVARELGIPAVFGVAGATHLLADGQRVEVDGGEGTIRCT